MIQITVQPNVEISKELYKKYYLYEFKKEWKRTPWKWSLPPLVAIILLAWLLDVELLFTLGLLAISLPIIVLVVWLARFGFAMNQYLKLLEKQDFQPFVFSINAEGFQYNDDHFNSSIQWSYLKEAIENNGDIYLVDKQGLFDIISTKLIGEKNFVIFKTTLLKAGVQLSGMKE